MFHEIRPRSPKLKAFPSPGENDLAQGCHALQNAEALEVTPGGTLWVADSGVAFAFGGGGGGERKRRCNAKLVSYDLTGRRKKEKKPIVLSEEVAPSMAGGVLFRQIVLDYHECGGDGPCFAYVSDAGSGAIVAVELSSGRARRLTAAAATASAAGPVKVAGGDGGGGSTVMMRAGVSGMAIGRGSLNEVRGLFTNPPFPNFFLNVMNKLP